MRVDRAAFLSITAGLFAAACAAGSKEAPADTVTIPPQPPPPEPAVSSSADARIPAPVAEAIDAGRPAEPVARGPGPTALASCGAEGPSPEACGKVTMPGPTCEQGLDPQADCEHLRRLLRADVAGAVVQCMHEKHASCTYFAYGSAACAKRALGESACAIPEAEAVCQTVWERCSTRKRRTTDPRNTVDVEVCRAAYSAVRPMSRKWFVSCMMESCAPEACFYVEAKDPPPPPGPRRPPSQSPKTAWKGPPDPVPPPLKACKLATDCVLSEECCTTVVTNWAGLEDARAALSLAAKKATCNRSCGVRSPQSADCVGGQCVVKP